MFAIIGEALIDMVIERDSNVLKSYFGGGPLNTAIALARLEETVYYNFPISNDYFGTKTLDFLNQNNVIYSYPELSHLPTTLAISSINKEKKSKYQFYREHTAQRDFNETLLLDIFHKNITCVHTGTLAIADNPDVGIISTVLNYARQNKIVVSVDPNVRPNIFKDHNAYINNLFTAMSYADIIKLSDDDAYYLYPKCTIEEAVEKMKAQFKNCSLLVITQAEKSILAYTPNTSINYQPKLMYDIGDTIGAGDCFIAGLLHGLEQNNILNVDALKTLSKEHLNTVVSLASSAAQHNCKSNGCNPPYKEDLI